MRCDQCVAVMINRVFCHEAGCPNTKSRYDESEGRWIRQVKCFTCGSTVDAGEPCCGD